ncbi:MAG: hypothetical protein FWH11_15035 [Micrococcales bacterium]|nr:hypothetical protein [Micrococcales bacterium]
MTARRAVRPAGTVGGDEADLRHVLPAPQPRSADPARPSRPDQPDAVPSHDETAEGWSEPPDDPNRLLAERPPHWS